MALVVLAPLVAWVLRIASNSVAKALKDAKDYTDTKDTAMGARVTAVETAIGVESDAVSSVVATGIYARLEALETTMTNTDIDNIINGLV